MFRANNANRYFHEAYNALKKSGRDLMKERRIAGVDALFLTHY